MKNKRLPIFYEGKPCYDIVFSTDFEALPAELSALGTEKRKICVVTDSKVALCTEMP